MIDYIFWLIVLIAAVIIEFATMGLFSIWFAAGALIAFFVALAGGGMILQLIVFFAVSIILLIFTRPIAQKHFNNRRVKTNAESLVGENAVVIEEIDNVADRGQVRVKGQEWTARSADGRILSKDTVVVINSIEGVKLIVSGKTDTAGPNGNQGGYPGSNPNGNQGSAPYGNQQGVYDGNQAAGGNRNQAGNYYGGQPGNQGGGCYGGQPGNSGWNQTGNPYGNPGNYQPGNAPEGQNGNPYADQNGNQGGGRR